MATYDLSTVIGKVRLLINDTDITDPQFEDDEITATYNMGRGSFSGQAAIYEAAASCLDSWVSTLASVKTGEKIGDYSYSLGGGAAGTPASIKSALADKYHKMAMETPAFAIGELDFENYGVEEGE